MENNSSRLDRKKRMEFNENNNKNNNEFDDEEEDDDDSLPYDANGKMNPCYITIENEQGHLEQMKINVDDNQFTIYPGFLNSSLYQNKKLYSSNSSSDSLCTDISSNPFKTIKKHRHKNKARKRIIAKGGSCNISTINVPKKNRLYFQDIFTTMIDMNWRYTFVAFAASFFLTWLLFACIWMFISWIHGDLEEENLPRQGYANGTWIPCVTGIDNFASAFLFSMETEHTIGYGTRATTEECPHAIILMCLQSIIGVLSSSCMAGVVFAKLTRPKYRVNTVIFSKNAVITSKNDILYLLFRLSNLRKSHIIGSHISAQLIHRVKINEDGELQNYYAENLKVSTSLEFDDEEKNMTLFPTIVSHKIDKGSPFYELGPKDVMESDFEFVVFLEGIVEPTGNSFQARTSYLPREIQWGMHFEEMISYNDGRYTVDISYLNAIVQDETPRLSMKALDHKKRKEAMIRKMSNSPSYRTYYTNKCNTNNSSIIPIDSPLKEKNNITANMIEDMFAKKNLSDSECSKDRKTKPTPSSRFSTIPIRQSPPDPIYEENE